MAELKNTVVNGSLAARRIYEDGMPLEQKYLSSVSFSDGKLKFGDTEIPLPSPTRSHSGGGLTKGTASGGGLSGGGLSVAGGGNQTVDISLDGQTTSGVTIQDSKPSSGYYLTVGASASGGSGTVTRAKINRAAFSQKVTRGAVTCTETAGWVPAGTHTCLSADSTGVTVSLDAGSIAAASETITVNSGSKTEYIVLPSATHSHSGGGLNKGTASGGGLSGGGLTSGSGSVSASGLTLSTTNTSGISVSGSGSVSRAAVTRAAFSQDVTRAAVTCTETAGWVPAGSHTCVGSTSTTVSLAADSTTIAATSKSSNTATKYVTDVAIPASKTLNSVTLTSGTSSARTYLNTVTVNGYTTIKDLTLSGIITKLTNNSGIIEHLMGSNNRITNLSGTTTITNNGCSTDKASSTMTITNNGVSSSYKGTVTVTTNTYGTVNVNGGKKANGGVSIEGKVVTVDGDGTNVGTSVTDSSGNLITATHTHSGGGLTKGSASGGGLSGGALSVAGGGNQTVDITLDGQTTSGVTIQDSKPSSGYYLTVGASASGGSGTVTRAKINRAAFSQTVSRAAVTCTETAGWVPAGTHTCLDSGSETVSLAAGSIAAASETITVNSGSKTEYIVIPGATGSISGGGLTISEGSLTISKGTDTNGTGNITSQITDNGTSEPTSGYYFSIRGIAAANTATRAATTQSVGTAGWLGASSQITGLSETTASNSAIDRNEYFKIPSAALGTIGKGTADVNIYTTDGSNSGVNISAIVGTKATSEPTSGYYLAFTGSGSDGSAQISTAGYAPTSLKATVGVTSATKYFPITASTITVNNPTISPTHGAVTPSVGGTVTSVATTTKPSSGTDGTDYLTINPGASITTQPQAIPSYTYSATAGYTPAISSTKKTGSVTNITPTVDTGTNYYLPKKTPSFDGGGLTVPNPTVDLSIGSDTNGTGNITSKLSQTSTPTTEPTSGYYFSIKGSASAVTATRAAVLYNGAVNGWVNVADNATALSSTTKSNSAVDRTEYFTVPSATITANNPTVSPTHGAVTPSVGGTVTSVATTTKPSSGTDGTDYLTIDPGASITTQPKATPSYTYSATEGYTAAVSSTTKTGSATNITPSVNAGTNYYLPKKTPSFDGGSGSGGGLTWDSSQVVLSDTNNGVSVSVTRAAVTRAAVLYNGAVNGWVNVADNTTALASGTIVSSATSTKYIDGLRVPQNQTVSNITLEGTIDTFEGSGTVGKLDGYMTAISVGDGSEFTIINEDGKEFYLYYENHEDAYQLVDAGVIMEASFNVSGNSVVCNNSGWVQSGTTTGTVPSSGITPSGNIQLTKQSGTDVTNYATASVRTGKVTQPTATQTGASVSYSGSTITLSKSVTPSVTTSGWVSSGTAGTLKMSGTISSTSTGNTIISSMGGAGSEGYIIYNGEIGFVVRAVKTSSISDPTSVSNCSCTTSSFQVGPYYIKEVVVKATGSNNSWWSMTFNGTTYGGLIINSNTTPDPGE